MIERNDVLRLDRAELRQMAGDPEGRVILDAALVELDQRVAALKQMAAEGEQLAAELRAGLARATQ